MIAKEALVSSVIAIAILVSVAMRRPLMSARSTPPGRSPPPWVDAQIPA